MLSFTVDPGARQARGTPWNRVMQDVYGPRWSLEPAQPRDFRMSLGVVQIGSVTLSRASLSQAQVSSRLHAGRGSAARSYNLYTVDQTQRMDIGGRSVILQPGDFTLADSALPSTLTTEQPYTTIGLTVPVDLLRAYVSSPERAVGLHFSGSEGLSKVVSLTLAELWRMAEKGSVSEVGNRLVVSLFEAFSACCHLTHSSAVPANPNAAARRAQVRDAIHKRLRDPDFSVASIATELGLSSRYLQMVFNDDGEPIRQYVRRKRLEGCRRELADPIWQDHSVTAIAFRWGFNSAEHFCRAFQALYGVSPSRFRREAGRQRPHAASTMRTLKRDIGG
jgi:AraC family transcriptional regulator, positive regulator of tynA and feaB